jgi:ketopantoate hydroxymethyltransferase
MIDAVARYAADVRARRFPGPEHVYRMDPAELEKLNEQVKR